MDSNTQLKTILPIFESTFDGLKINAVDGRALHLALGSKKHFNDWIKAKIIELKLKVHRDYEKCSETQCSCTTPESAAGIIGFAKVDYILSARAAMHISMTSFTERGHEVREYFIALEDAKLKAAQYEPLPPPPAVIAIGPSTSIQTIGSRIHTLCDRIGRCNQTIAVLTREAMDADRERNELHRAMTSRPECMEAAFAAIKLSTKMAPWMYPSCFQKNNKPSKHPTSKQTLSRASLEVYLYKINFTYPLARLA